MTRAVTTYPVANIHAGDYAAWYKHATGEWIYDFTAGQITSCKTGKIIPFRINRNGYLEASVIIRGVRIQILKHRAIWIASHGILTLPLDSALEVDQINRDRTDCRLENLRLIDSRIKLPGNRKRFSDTTAREIRRRYNQEKISMEKLAHEFGVARSTIASLIHYVTYRSVSDE